MGLRPPPPPPPLRFEPGAIITYSTCTDMRAISPEEFALFEQRQKEMFEQRERDWKKKQEEVAADPLTSWIADAGDLTLSEYLAEWKL